MFKVYFKLNYSQRFKRLLYLSPIVIIAIIILIWKVEFIRAVIMSIVLIIIHIISLTYNYKKSKDNQT